MLAALFMAGFLFVTLGVVRLTLQSQEQLHVQHVADYVADAAGIIAARDLNFKAVTNRAMLANEVVIGQLMGLSSWFSMGSKTMENIALISAWVPYLGPVMQGVSKVVKGADQAIKKALPAAVKAQQLVLQLLQSAQFTFHAASWASSILTMQEIVEASHPEYELALLNHASLQSFKDVWMKMQTRRSGHAQHIEYIRMVAESRDGFSQKRTYRWLTLPFVKANKLGASEVGQQAGKVYWHAIDTTALQVGGFFTDKELPLGWGANYLQKKLPYKLKGLGYGGSYKVLPFSSYLAAKSALPIPGGHQVPSQYVLTDYTAPVYITVAVRKPANEETGAPKRWGVGRTELVYSRPAKWWPRADQAYEKPNLFNAFWRRQKAPVHPVELELLGLQI
ncbi:hypothetical protein CWE15_01625 [Aliidiomarina taiwanensis]|uniref:Uncharacterized protein n=2 Tax=Aliidiomarina taiwanensis TaxID=946228 RepID=A0A432X9B9_9GAMM|nr:hypothetical protein CWE15_01625 [Aliidiomarina taiwanensis]